MDNAKIKNIYNNLITDRFKNDYEFERWFLDGRSRADYFMTYLSIKHHIKDTEYKNCLELGPGPGTWTRLLYKHKPEASFELVDISKEMKNQFQLEMRTQNNIKYHISDIEEFQSSEQFDFFFSSRAIEYVSDKTQLLNKLFKLLSDNGRGAILTKNPSYAPWRKKDQRPQHKNNQIPIKVFKQELAKAGFKNIRVYPVIVRLPIIDRINTKISERLFSKSFKNELDQSWLEKVTESYMVTFEK